MLLEIANDYRDWFESKQAEEKAAAEKQNNTEKDNNTEERSS